MLSVSIPETMPPQRSAPSALAARNAMPFGNMISVSPDGTLKWRGETHACALGRAGITATKREGDGATPMGCFNLRRVLYRPDREAPPDTFLAVDPIFQMDGWCDAAGDTNYNRPVVLPYPAGAEKLWRDDHAYDVVAVLGYNDQPVVPDCGSAIFLHVAAPDYAPTQGCIAMARDDLVAMLRDCDPETRLCVFA